MARQIIFIISVILTLGIFSWTILRYYSWFKFTKPFPIKDYGRRFKMMMEVAFGQTKIFRFPFVGLMHALVFWGFCVILIGSIEMIIDGIFNTDKILGGLGIFYDIITASGDIKTGIVTGEDRLLFRYVSPYSIFDVITKLLEYSNNLEDIA